jgi:PEGA domain
MGSFERNKYLASKVLLILIFICIAGCIRPAVRVSDGPVTLQPSVTSTPAPTPIRTVSIMPGSISISTYPSNAQIFLNGAYKGRSPLFIRDVYPGTKVIQVKLSGYHFEWVTFDLKSGETYSNYIQLTRYPSRDDE